MRGDFEAAVLHNPVFGAKALWHFARSYQAGDADGTPPPLPTLMLVLPMAFHRRTARATHNMNYSSGLLRALTDAPDIIYGLQERVEAFSDRTFKSLTLACGAALITRTSDRPFPRFRAKAAFPEALNTDHPDVKQTLACARRLGRWFAQDDFSSLCNLLQVSF